MPFSASTPRPANSFPISELALVELTLDVSQALRRVKPTVVFVPHLASPHIEVNVTPDRDDRDPRPLDCLTIFRVFNQKDAMLLCNYFQRQGLMGRAVVVAIYSLSLPDEVTHGVATVRHYPPGIRIGWVPQFPQGSLSIGAVPLTSRVYSPR